MNADNTLSIRWYKLSKRDRNVLCTLLIRYAYVQLVMNTPKTFKKHRYFSVRQRFTYILIRCHTLAKTSRCDSPFMLGDCNASTGTDRDGYETCVGPHGSGTVNQNSTKFLDFERSYGQRVPGSWFQCPQAHHWTWYSNTGGVAMEVDHVLVVSHWRMIQHCRVYWSAQFLNTDHRLVVATLKLQLQSRRMVPSQHRLDVGSSRMTG